MKKIILNLSAISICLVSCGKESQFKTAINDKLSKDSYKCLSLPSSYYGYGMSANEDDYKKFQEKTKGSIVEYSQYDKDGKTSDISDSKKEDIAQLEALTSAGFFTKTTESLPTYFGWGENKKPDGGYYSYVIYTPTAEADKTRVKVDTNSMSKSLFGDNGNRIFCYAHQEVDKIDSYTEGNFGVEFVDVKYAYKYVDIADWINKPGIKEAFPEIDKALNDPDKNDHMELVKTSKGWSGDK